MKEKKVRARTMKRDRDMIRFLEKTKLLIGPEEAAIYFYKTRNDESSIRVAQRRLKAMYEKGDLKRHRVHIDESYVYYYYKYKLPTKRKHKLKIAEVASEFCLAFDGVKDIKVEYNRLESNYDLRPDLYLVLDINGQIIQVLIEVDISKQFSNYDKYKLIMRDYANKKLEHLFPYPLLIVSCCEINPELKNIQWIDLDLTNFDDFIRKLKNFVLKLNLKK